MSAESLPVSSFDSLLVKLIVVLKLTQEPDGVVTTQAKQRLLQAVCKRNHLTSHFYNLSMQTNDFKGAIAQAKELAENLPGGELMTEDQDDVIQMLQALKERKR